MPQMKHDTAFTSRAPKHTNTGYFASNGQTKGLHVTGYNYKSKEKNGLKKVNDESVVDSQAPASHFYCCVV